MLNEQFTNNAVSYLVNFMVPSDGVLTVGDATTFPPNPQFRIVVDAEIMLVTAVTGNDFTVERAAEEELNGGPAAYHNAGSAVTLVVTAGALKEIVDEINTIEEAPAQVGGNGGLSEDEIRQLIAEAIGEGDTMGFTGARVRRTTAQTITTGTWTAISFDNARYDSSKFFDPDNNPTRISPLAAGAGYYNIGGSVEWATDAAANSKQCAVRVNGTLFVGTNGCTNKAANTALCSVNTQLYLNAGDYVEFMVYHDKGSNLNVNASGNYSPEFWIQKMGT